MKVHVVDVSSLNVIHVVCSRYFFLGVRVVLADKMDMNEFSDGQIGLLIIRVTST